MRIFSTALFVCGIALTPVPVSAATFSSIAVQPQNPVADHQTSQTYTVSLTGTSPAVARCLEAHFNYGSITVPPPTGKHWQYAGGAKPSTNAITLTEAGQQFAGASAVYDVALPSAGMHVSFDGYLGGGEGADGMTFALLDSSNWSGYAGNGGGGLGYSGLDGVAVTIDTYANDNDPGSNFIGIATSGTNGAMTYSTTSTTVPPLRNVLRQYDIVVSNNHLVVSIDGVQYLDQNVTLPSSIYPAFTAGTGGATDRHSVENVVITSAGAGANGNSAAMPAGMSTTGPNLSGSTAITGSDWYLTDFQAIAIDDKIKWTNTTGQAVRSGTLLVDAISSNPSIPGTYFLRIDTYSDVGCTSLIDSGSAPFVVVNDEAGVDVSLAVMPSLSMTVTGQNSGLCNGQAITELGSTGTAITLGEPNPTHNTVAAQALVVSTNSSHGYRLSLRVNDSLRHTSGVMVPDWSGTHALPTSFPASGTAAFAYTTDHALSGSALRFQPNKWAGPSHGAEEVAFGTGVAASDSTRVCFQVGVGAGTPAGSYRTVINYLLVPTF